MREIEKIVNSLIKMDVREKVSAGTIVKAIILNGLGYMSKPLYLFPEFFRDKPVEKLLGKGIKAEEIMDEQELSSEEMLKQYKNQQSCERGFRFLKDPLLLTKSVYVKSPKRK